MRAAWRAVRSDRAREAGRSHAAKSLNETFRALLTVNSKSLMCCLVIALSTMADFGKLTCDWSCPHGYRTRQSQCVDEDYLWLSASHCTGWPQSVDVAGHFPMPRPDAWLIRQG